jgi:hypothetical protein
MGRWIIGWVYFGEAESDAVEQTSSFCQFFLRLLVEGNAVGLFELHHSLHSALVAGRLDYWLRIAKFFEVLQQT